MILVPNANGKPTRPSVSAPAVHSVNEFVFTVPDITLAEHFYLSFGLDVRRDGDCLELYTFGHAQRWGRILPGASKRLCWLSFGICQEDLLRFAAVIDQMGVEPIAPPAGANQEGLWIKGPDALPLQLLVADKCSPSVKSARVFPPEVSTSGRAPRRSQIQPVRPNHLSHILLFTKDVDASRAFYAAVLGLQLSDHSGAVIAFMHGAHGSDHHLLALAKSEGCGLHHTSWDVSSIDDVAIGSEQMASAGYGGGWGIGRHVLGSNYFRYVRDPWGSYAEYSFDIDFIPKGAVWPAADYPAEDSLYAWGEPVPADFIVNYEIT